MNKMNATFFVGCMMLMFAIGGTLGDYGAKKEHQIELKALQAQVDKKYCKGEVTYLQLREEFLK